MIIDRASHAADEPQRRVCELESLLGEFKDIQHHKLYLTVAFNILETLDPSAPTFLKLARPAVQCLSSAYLLHNCKAWVQTSVGLVTLKCHIRRLRRVLRIY